MSALNAVGLSDPQMVSGQQPAQRLMNVYARLIPIIAKLKEVSSENTRKLEQGVEQASQNRQYNLRWQAGVQALTGSLAGLAGFAGGVVADQTMKSFLQSAPPALSSFGQAATQGLQAKIAPDDLKYNLGVNVKLPQAQDKEQRLSGIVDSAKQAVESAGQLKHQAVRSALGGN